MNDMPNISGELQPLRVFIDKSLVEEFRIRKEIYERKLGYKINGGTPVVSKICAEILKRDRTNSKDKIVIEVKKQVGVKKVDTIFL